MTTATPSTNPAIQASLDAIKKQFGFVPQILADMANNSPAIFFGYMELARTIEANSTLTKQEQMGVMLYTSALNKCPYCCAAHSRAGKALGISTTDLQAMAKGELPTTPDLKLLCSFTQAMWEARGNISAATQTSFNKQGLTTNKQLDVVALMGLKTLTNYSHGITHSAIDAQFK